MELVQSARGCASFAQLRIGGAQHGGREIDEVVVSEVLLDAAYGLAFALVGEGGGAQRSLPLVVELLGMFSDSRDDALARGSLAAAQLPSVLLEGVDGIGLGPVNRD